MRVSARKVLLLSSILCCFLFPLFSQNRTVTIESAKTTEYLKSGAEGEESEEIVFRGSVVISVKDDKNVSRIGADEIRYDKTRNMLHARGNVFYERKTGAAGSQKFTGEALLFDIQELEGVFLDGIVTQDSGKKSGDPYIVHADITGRNTGSTMAFKNAMLTSCDYEEPHWSINASRLWLLPGNEIAFVNGLFFIGPLPVMYFPFFYYPSDEMIVHPVFGYRNREGFFVQTTTYLMGRKPLEKSDSTGTTFANFLQSDSLKEQERHGLFLKNLESDDKGSSGSYIKFLADAYSSLGGMAGLEGNFTPKESFVNSVQFSLMLGLSKNLYPPASSSLAWSTYGPNGLETKNESWFFGNKLPFRYRFSFSLKMNKDPFSVNVSLPLISDTFFRKDFTDRSEDLNWFKYLMESEKLAKGNYASIAEETAYSWDVNGTINPKISALNPWIDTIKIQKLSALLTFNSKKNVSITDGRTPESIFFHPDNFKPELTVGLGGTLFSTKNEQVKKPSDSAPASGEGPENPFLPPAESSEPEVKDPLLDRFIPSPDKKLVPQVTVPVSDFALKWALSPLVLQEVKYDSSEWENPTDVDWNTYRSIYLQSKGDARITGEYSFNVSVLTVNSNVKFTWDFRDHPWFSDKEQLVEKNKALLTDYKATGYSVSGENTVQYKPFRADSIFNPTALSWNLNAQLLKNAFEGNVDNPYWKLNSFEWDKEYVQKHTATTLFGLLFADYPQKITLTSNLPPLLESYKGDLSLTFGKSTFTMGTRHFEKENAEKKWYWDPLTTMLTISLPFNSKLVQSFSYNIEEDEPTDLNYTLSRESFSAHYKLTNTFPFTLQAGKGWIIEPGSEKDFLPSSAGFSFNNSGKPVKLIVWKNRILVNASLSSQMNFNLLKLTESSFDFKPALTVKIHEFLDITFNSTSRNDVIARYYQDLIELPQPIPGETNIVKDLGNSFNFFDERKRTQSGFKLKDLSLTATHYLHDWTSSFDLKLKPEFRDNPKRYEFIPAITFMVQWKPISDIKTTVKSEKGAFSLNTTDPKPK